MSLVSKAPSKQYDEFFERAFGKDAPVKKGKFKYDSTKGAVVEIEEEGIKPIGECKRFSFPDIRKVVE
jgi:hypothetical protein